MTAQERKALAVRRGVRIALADLTKQLLNLGDAVSAEAAGLLALATATILRAEVDALAEEAAIAEYRDRARRGEVRHGRR
jgi:hypothetical protein